MTHAQQYLAAQQNDEGDVVESLYESAISHLLLSGDRVVEFADGSVYSEDPDYTDDNEQPIFTSMDDFRETVSIINEIQADILEYEGPQSPIITRRYPPRGYVVVRGRVEEGDGFAPADASLTLTDMTRDGKPLRLGSTDYHEEPQDSAPLAYTERLAALVGREVTIQCQIAHYREERCTARGNHYHVDVDYLDAPMVVTVHEQAV